MNLNRNYDDQRKFQKLFKRIQIQDLSGSSGVGTRVTSS